MEKTQLTTTIADPASVLDAIASRYSVRAFTQEAVSSETITAILNAARRAASGTNTQPWKVYVVTGETRDRIVREVCAAHDQTNGNAVSAPTPGQFSEEYDYYPTTWVSPYIDRRRHNGWTLYGLLGIGKGDKEKMHAQAQRNFKFFDAPVGFFFTIDRVLGRGSMLDYGMFLQNIMLAARAHGLHTCPQAAWNNFHALIKPILGAGENEMLVCGMALGHADKDALVNTYGTPREEVASFTTWLK
jgi:nitroreductase